MNKKVNILMAVILLYFAIHLVIAGIRINEIEDHLYNMLELEERIGQVYDSEDIIFIKVDEVKETESPSLPKNNSFKSFMSYKKVTNKKSDQHKLLNDPKTEINDLGILRHEGRYLIAVGGQFGAVGDKIKVTLDSGEVLDCIIGDIKDKKDITEEGQCKINGSIIEFIVDQDKLPKIAKQMGDISYLDSIFEGEVVSIRVDE